MLTLAVYKYIHNVLIIVELGNFWKCVYVLLLIDIFWKIENIQLEDLNILNLML